MYKVSAIRQQGVKSESNAVDRFFEDIEASGFCWDQLLGTSHTQVSGNLKKTWTRWEKPIVDVQHLDTLYRHLSKQLTKIIGREEASEVKAFFESCFSRFKENWEVVGARSVVQRNIQVIAELMRHVETCTPEKAKEILSALQKEILPTDIEACPEGLLSRFSDFVNTQVGSFVAPIMKDLRQKHTEVYLKRHGISSGSEIHIQELFKRATIAAATTDRYACNQHSLSIPEIVSFYGEVVATVGELAEASPTFKSDWTMFKVSIQGMVGILPSQSSSNILADTGRIWPAVLPKVIKLCQYPEQLVDPNKKWMKEHLDTLLGESGFDKEGVCESPTGMLALLTHGIKDPQLRERTLAVVLEVLMPQKPVQNRGENLKALQLERLYTNLSHVHTIAQQINAEASSQGRDELLDAALHTLVVANPPLPHAAGAVIKLLNCAWRYQTVGPLEEYSHRNEIAKACASWEISPPSPSYETFRSSRDHLANPRLPIADYAKVACQIGDKDFPWEAVVLAHPDRAQAFLSVGVEFNDPRVVALALSKVKSNQDPDPQVQDSIRDEVLRLFSAVCKKPEFREVTTLLLRGYERDQKFITEIQNQKEIGSLRIVVEYLPSEALTALRRTLWGWPEGRALVIQKLPQREAEEEYTEGLAAVAEYQQSSHFEEAHLAYKALQCHAKTTGKAQDLERHFQGQLQTAFRQDNPTIVTFLDRTLQIRLTESQLQLGLESALHDIPVPFKRVLKLISLGAKLTAAQQNEVVEAACHTDDSEFFNRLHEGVLSSQALSDTFARSWLEYAKNWHAFGMFQQIQAKCMLEVADETRSCFTGLMDAAVHAKRWDIIVGLTKNGVQPPRGAASLLTEIQDPKTSPAARKNDVAHYKALGAILASLESRKAIFLKANQNIRDVVTKIADLETLMGKLSPSEFRDKLFQARQAGNVEEVTLWVALGALSHLDATEAQTWLAQCCHEQKFELAQLILDNTRHRLTAQKIWEILYTAEPSKKRLQFLVKMVEDGPHLTRFDESIAKVWRDAIALKDEEIMLRLWNKNLIPGTQFWIGKIIESIRTFPESIRNSEGWSLALDTKMKQCPARQKSRLNSPGEDRVVVAAF